MVVAMANPQYVWFDGKFVDFAKATVHVLTHSLQYGSGVFEGIRAYETAKGKAIFRLQEHIARFMRGIKVMSLPVRFSGRQLSDAVVKTVIKNRQKECYIRPFAFYNDKNIGLGTANKKASVIIATIPLAAYFSKKNTGIGCMVSSWSRINSTIIPPEVKASGNYLNSILASSEAKRLGMDEAIMLSIDGYVAEGPGENIFIVEDEKLITPPKEADILPGITRDSVIQLAKANGISVEERNIHREELFTCDEAFFCGTAAEITPILKIDAYKLGNGKIGNTTRQITDSYTRAVHGAYEEFESWLIYV
jgi:branched-chain amino acid aminotransferase